MNTELVGRDILHLEETDSTNSALKEMAARENLREGFCLYTNYQRSGRGQYGKQWQSDPGQNLLMSVFLQPSFLPPDQAYRLTMSVCLALHDVGRSLGFSSSFKWPNDWFFGDQKLGGLLMEASLQKGRLENCIVGIGINVKQKNFGALAATSLEKVCGRELFLEQLLAQVLTQLDRRYLELREGYSQKQHHEFQALLWKWQAEIPVEVEGQKYRGVVLGVEPSGELKFQLKKSGEIRRFRHREIEFLRA